MRLFLSFVSAVFLIMPTTFAQDQVDARLNTVQVSESAEKNTQDVQSIPASVELVSKQKIELEMPTTLNDVLKNTPGVSFTGGTQSSTQKPSIRGLSNDRVLVVIDRAKQKFSTAHGGQIFTDLNLYKQIEILKGSASSLYGSNAMGGVIALKRKFADDFEYFNDKNYGLNLSSNYHSANNSSHNLLSTYAKYDSLGVLLNLSRSRSDDLELSDDTKLVPSGTDKYSLSGNMYYNISKASRLEVSGEYFNESGFLAENPGQEVTIENTIIDRENSNESLQITHKYNPDSTYINSLATVYFNQTINEKKSTLTKTLQTDSLNGEFTNTSEFIFNSWLASVTTGLELNLDVNTGKEGSASYSNYPDGESTQLSAYLQSSIEVPKVLRVVPSLRYDQSSRKSTGIIDGKQSDEQLSSKLSVAYFPVEQLNLYVSYNEGFNSPRIQDLYVTGLHFQAGPQANNFIPNPDLEAEVSKNYETGFKWIIFKENSNNLLNFNVSYFENYIDNFIKQEVLATTTQFINIYSVELKGYEAQVMWQFDRLSTDLSYSQTKSFNTVENEPINDTPSDKWVLSLNYKFLENRNLLFGVHTRYYEEQSRVPTGTAETGAYAIHDLLVSWTPQDYSNLKLLLNVNNVFDREHKAHESYIMGTARDIRLGLNVSF